MRVSGTMGAKGRYRVDIDAAGHALVADEPTGHGGGDAGPNPYALVLAGLAACTGITLRMYAERKGWGDVGLAITLDFEFGSERRTIQRRVSVTGAPDDAAIQRLRDIVERTPVTLALKEGFEILTELAAAN